MRTYRCVCENVIFFDNNQCVACGRELGYCPACGNMVALVPIAGAGWKCANPACGATLFKCSNYDEHKVCNRCLATANPVAGALCDCCRFNFTIPDLTVPGNWEKWQSLEAAKRRLFYDLDQLKLPYGTAADGFAVPLSFDFKADVIPERTFWRSVGRAERVYTGHAAGRITINIREADAVEREKLRVDMGEAHRTLIGHFRHEIGHYYWDVLVKGRCEEQFQLTFGNPYQPDYGAALDAHYKNGPPADWSLRYVSAYASMHPWEDFAESWATYLDMTSTLDTARNLGLIGAALPATGDITALLISYQHLGIALNEINRNMGLLDLVPEVFAPPVVQKMQFVHALILQAPQVDVRAAAQPPGSNGASQDAGSAATTTAVHLPAVPTAPAPAAAPSA